jgi:hypothetical protein
VTISRRNYDPSTNLNWHRKVTRHPDESMHSLAEAFCNSAAAWLSISPPRIFWFEEADFVEAQRVWLESSSRSKSAADPLREECEYFRWPNPSGQRGPAVLAGYTHRELPLGVMINVCRDGEDLLKTVAHECFHIHQDAEHGVGWRARTENRSIVEKEADAWVRSKDHEIKSFLKEYRPCVP